MTLVIEIDENTYNEIMYDAEYTPMNLTHYERIIAKGTPLPKGHGRLIDEKEIETVVNGVFTGLDKHSPETFLNVIHNQCIEAVGADKAESEE